MLTFEIKKGCFLIELKEQENYEYIVHSFTFSFISLAYPSASLLFPTS